MFHRREHLNERIGNLCHGRYLQVEVQADDTYMKREIGLLMGIHFHINLVTGEIELGVAEPKVLCCVHKLQEMWDGKRGLLEDDDMGSLKARGNHPRNNRFQISVNALEHKPAKVRKCDGCNDWHKRELSLNGTAGNSEKEADHERLQLRHE